MKRAMTCLAGAVLAFLIFSPTVRAQTVTANSCSSVDVQAALNKVTASTTLVVIPDCGVGGTTWTTKVSFSVPNGSSNLTIEGQGVCTPSGTPGTAGYTISCDDASEIVDGLSGTGGLLSISGINASTLFRITGLTFSSGRLSYGGLIGLNGSSNNVRFDHNHIVFTSDQPGMAMARINGCINGVADHNLLVMPTDSGSDSGIGLYNAGTCYGDALGVGDQAWAHPTDLGGSDFFFLEDNEIINGAGNDCYYGRYVWRYNTSHVTYPAPPVETHPTGGAGRWRGCRAWEIYDNYIDDAGGRQPNAEALRLESGTGVVFGNIVPSSPSGTNAGPEGYQVFLAFHSERSSNATYGEKATPSGWGYCGTSFNGTGSNWDQNLNLLTGYRCLDNIGNGQGDLLTGGFTSDGSGTDNVSNVATGCLANLGCAWPRQAPEPVYEWMDSFAGIPGWNSNYYTTDSAALANNRDFYTWCNASSASGCTSFNGTQGVGSGPLSARPNTCTPGAGTDVPGVGYWATDQNTLYVCENNGSSNVWVSYYSPYQYPHPLDTANQLSNGPAAPTGLQATVQ